MSDDALTTELVVPPADVRRAMCAACWSLIHVWSSPATEPVELPVICERFSIVTHHCVCRCGCLATLAHPGPYPADRNQSAPLTVRRQQ